MISSRQLNNYMQASQQVKAGDSYKVDIGGCCPKLVKIISADQWNVRFRVEKTGAEQSMPRTLFNKKSYRYTLRR